MSNALLHRDFKAHRRLLLVFTMVLLMYFIVILGMYDPANPGLMGQLAAFKLPPALLAAFGFDLALTELSGFLAGYFYGMLMVAFPMVLLVMLANRLVAYLVERGTMAAVLAGPVTRRQAALTQGVFLFACTLSQALVITLAGLLLVAVQFKGLLDIHAFLRLNAGALCLHLFISGLSFFFSCLFSDTRWSLGLGTGLPVLFLLMDMLSRVGEKLAVLRYLTPFSLYDPLALLKGGQAPQVLALLLAGLVFYGAGLAVFDKKDLPL